MTSSRSPLRLLRGGTAATLATMVALGGHLSGGGDMPSALGVLVPWWLSVTLCAVLAGSRFSLLRLSLAVLGSQALFHSLFSLGTPGASNVVMVSPPGSHLGHGAAQHAVPVDAGGAVDAAAVHSHGADGMVAVTGHALAGGHGDAQMLLGHVLAALLTTVLLHRGERLLLRCAGLVGAVLAVLARPPHRLEIPALALPGPARPVLSRTPVLPRRRAVLDPRLQRGPPLVLAA